MAEEKNEEKGESWWLLVLQGIGALIFTGFLYWGLTRLEESGEAASAPWWFVLLYKWGGKWLVIGILALGSVLLLYSGMEKLIVGEAKPEKKNSKRKKVDKTDRPPRDEDDE